MKQIQLWQGHRLVLAEANANSLVDGYHAYEHEEGIRWTNGNAAIPEELFAGMSGSSVLLVKIGGSTCYLDDTGVGRAA